MSRFHRLLGALTLALFLPALAAADDEQEISNYVLTDAGLAKYSQASRQLAALPDDRARACDDEGDVESISEVAAKMDSYPAAKSAIQSAGLTSREYVVFSFALLQTGLAVWGADQAGGKLPPGTSAANVAWYRKNAANLKKLEATNASEACDDAFAEEEEDDGESGE